MRRIAVINQKGGVGKTTTSTNLGAALAEQGRRVVLVDMDPQANLSLHLGLEIPSDEPSTYTLLSGDAPFGACVRESGIEGLRVVPSNIELSGAELELASAIGRETLLRDSLEDWVRAGIEEHGREPADYVVFDCPPSLGLLSINALAAAGEVLVTVQTEFLALQGMSKLMEIVQLLRRKLNPTLEIAGIVPCLYDSRLRLAREVLAEMRAFFPGQVLRESIRSNVKLAEAPSFGQTILQYAPESKGALDHRRLALAILAQEGRHPSLAGLPAPRSLEELRARVPLPAASPQAAPPPGSAAAGGPPWGEGHLSAPLAPSTPGEASPMPDESSAPDRTPARDGTPAADESSAPHGTPAPDGIPAPSEAPPAGAERPAPGELLPQPPPPPPAGLRPFLRLGRWRLGFARPAGEPAALPPDRGTPGTVGAAPERRP